MSMVWFICFLVITGEFKPFSDAGANNITWYEPPPVENTADSTLTKTHNIQLPKGATNVSLSWNFTLHGNNSIFDLVQVYSGTDVVVSHFPNGQATVSDKFSNMVSATWFDSKITLVFRIVTADGELSCKVFTKGGREVWTRNIKWNVVDALTVIQHCPTSVTEGDNVTLNCSATGNPASTITWIRGSTREVLSNNKIHMITDIKRNESDRYECHASNGVGKNSTKSCTLDVQYRPKIVNPPSEYSVAEQQSVHLSCHAEGNPTPSYTWTPCKDGCNESTLVIPEVSNDTVYTCTVANALGSDSASTSVVIAAKEINITLTITGESCTNEQLNKTLLSSKLTKEIDKAFVNDSAYTSTTLKNVRCGSFTVDLSLMFSSIVSEKWVLTKLKEAAKCGKLKELNVAASSIKRTRPIISSTTSPPIGKTTPRSYDIALSPSSDSGNILWSIMGAVVGTIFVISIIVAAVWLWLRKKKKKKWGVNDESRESHRMSPVQPGPEKPETISLMA